MVTLQRKWRSAPTPDSILSGVSELQLGDLMRAHAHSMLCLRILITPQPSEVIERPASSFSAWG